VVLRESHAPYTVTIGDEALSHEPLILERDGEPVAAVVPMAEYEAFCAWRDAEERARRRRPDLEAFERERQAFERLKPELLRTHRGQWVAIYQGEMVEAGHDRSLVMDRVFGRLGYVQLYVQKVEEQPQVYRLPHRAVVR
jgi:hypothetical protein